MYTLLIISNGRINITGLKTIFEYDLAFKKPIFSRPCFYERIKKGDGKGAERAIARHFQGALEAIKKELR